jgi:hypothetical protein
LYFTYTKRVPVYSVKPSVGETTPFLADP